MGKEMYVATSPKDIQSIYKEATKLDMDPIVFKIMCDFNCSMCLSIRFQLQLTHLLGQVYTSS
jgi:hypothetical protein